MTITPQEMLAELRRVIEAGNQKNIQVRALGGLAIQTQNKTNHPLFLREYADLDLVIAKKQRRDFEAFMPEVGYLPDKQFNVLNGDTRQIYYHEASGLKADIFVGNFEMCHRIPLEDRLKHDPVTVPLAELLLTKAQIIELNRKDALDLTSVLLNHETGEEDSSINLKVIADLCSQDWGLYKTVSINLERLLEFINGQDVSLSEYEHDVIQKNIRSIQHTFEVMPKPIAWQLRDRVGTRVKWYIEVEEVDL